MLKHRGPVNSRLMRMGTGHNRMFRVRNDQGLYLFKRTINTQLLAMGSTRLHEVRILLGCTSHPRGSRVRLAGKRVVARSTGHPVDRRHLVAHGVVLVRVARTARGHSMAIHGPIAELRTHHTIGSWGGVTDFILNRLGRVCRRGSSLRSLQMGLRVRQVGRASRVAPTYGALLEVTLQNVTTRESVLAENTHVRPITSV